MENESGNGTKEPKKVSDFETYNSNPSLIHIAGLTSYRAKKPVMGDAEVKFVESDDRTLMKLPLEGQYEWKGKEWRDSARFTKLFEGAEKEIGNLSMTSVRVLMLMVSELVSETDIVKIDAEDYKDKLGYNVKKSVYDGIFGLLKAKLIFRKAGQDSEYFLNVQKIFKGRRGVLKNKE